MANDSPAHLIGQICKDLSQFVGYFDREFLLFRSLGIGSLLFAEDGFEHEDRLVPTIFALRSQLSPRFFFTLDQVVARRVSAIANHT
jgi:hypothetical protein